MRIDLKPDAVARCIDEVGFGFMFAPAHHGATRFVVPVRKELAVRTIFNFLGPLTNPAGAQRQVIGVSDPHFLETIAGALARLGARQGAGSVQRRRSGRDEHVGRQRASSRSTASSSAPTRSPRRTWGSRAPSLPRSRAGTPDVNAETTRRIFAGDHGPARDVAVLNAGAAIYVSGTVDSSGSGRARRGGRDRRRPRHAGPGITGEPDEGAGACMSVLDRIVDDTRDEVKRRKKAASAQGPREADRARGRRLAAVLRGAHPPGRVA